MRPTATRHELSQLASTAGAMTLTTQQIFSLGTENDPRAALERMRARRTEVMEIEKGLLVCFLIVISPYRTPPQEIPTTTTQIQIQDI